MGEKLDTGRWMGVRMVGRDGLTEKSVLKRRPRGAE